MFRREGVQYQPILHGKCGTPDVGAKFKPNGRSDLRVQSSKSGCAKIKKHRARRVIAFGRPIWPCRIMLQEEAEAAEISVLRYLCFLLFRFVPET